MNVLDIIKRYYKQDSDLYNMLIGHSTDVKNKALKIAEKHKELNADTQFIKEASMLHDIGILLTNAPTIHCHGILPYICHGHLGREMMDRLGYPRHGLVCERHTGVGLSQEDIIRENLPLPHRDMIPVSIEEKIICFADCFFSKTALGVEKSIEEAREALSRFGEEKVVCFDQWCSLFL